MESVFSSLSKRQTMLLLTGVTFGGHDCMQAFDFLVGYEADLLKHRAQELMQIPRDKRIPLLVQEIKRIVTARSGELHSADPESLAEVLIRERLGARELLLRAFPEALAQAVRDYLPPTPRGYRPPKRLRPEILSILRSRVEEALREAGVVNHFRFSDVLLLQTRELLTLCDHFGARALGPAVAGLAPAERDAFLGKLPPDLLAMIHRSAEAAQARKLTDRDAEELLEIHGAPESAADAVRSAGAQKLARACLAQSAEFAARLVERQRGEFGALLVKWVREERAKAVSRGDGGRTEIVEELEQMEKAGLVSRPARTPHSAGKGKHHRRVSKPMPAIVPRPVIPAEPKVAQVVRRPSGPKPGQVVRRPSGPKAGAEPKPPSRPLLSAGARPSTASRRAAEQAQPERPPLGGRPPSSNQRAVEPSERPPLGARPPSSNQRAVQQPGPAERAPGSAYPRPPSDRVPLSAQARGDSASAKFRAAAEAAAPKQRSSVALGEGEVRKSSSQNAWSEPRPAAAAKPPSDPSVTVPPHRVKKGSSKQGGTDEVTDPGPGGGPRPKTGSKPEKG